MKKSKSGRALSGQPRPHAKCCGTYKYTKFCSSCGKKLGLIANTGKIVSTTTVTPKLELNQAVIAKAKKIYAKAHGLSIKDLEKVHFSKTLEYACEQHLSTILKRLSQAGMTKTPNLEKNRPRRISISLWAELENHCSNYDISRIKLIRAVLNLLVTPKKSQSNINKQNGTSRLK